MAMNGLEAMHEALIDHKGKEIFVDEALRERAMVPLNRMLDFSAQLKARN